HLGLGEALSNLNRPAEAEKVYRQAIVVRRDCAEAHYGLGLALLDLGRPPEAVDAFRKTIELKKDYAPAHYNLGNALREMGKLPDAAEAFRAAIKVAPGFAEAHCNLGQVLSRQGQFADAVTHLKRGHELGTKRGNWDYPSAQWVREAERLVELDGKLPAVLRGEAKPADAAERVAGARRCVPQKTPPAAAAGLFAEALADPQSAEGVKAAHRYNAACAAALAGAGQGEDGAKLDDKERARWRKQAVDWLRA